jgi:hypothetical protein
VFTKKHLERRIDTPLDDVRTESNYGVAKANDDDRQVVESVRNRFRDVLIRERLDAKSFFQDLDKLRHFKVTGR